MAPHPRSPIFQIVGAHPDIGFGLGKSFEVERAQRSAPDGAVGAFLRPRDGDQPAPLPRLPLFEPGAPAQNPLLQHLRIRADRIAAARDRLNPTFRLETRQRRPDARRLDPEGRAGAHQFGNRERRRRARVEQIEDEHPRAHPSGIGRV